MRLWRHHCLNCQSGGIPLISDPMQSYKRETSCFIVPNHGIISITSNDSSGFVEFDFFSIWEKLKKIDHDLVYMIHSHPPGFDCMSGMDWNMVYGWCQAIGKPILFLIITENKTTIYLCKRDIENKSKINREIVNLKENENLNVIISAIYYISTIDRLENNFSFDGIIEILNNYCQNIKLEIDNG